MLKLERLISDFYKEQAKSNIKTKIFKKGDFNYITIDGTSLYRYRRFVYDINAPESNLCDMIPDNCDSSRQVYIKGIEVLPDCTQLYMFTDEYGNVITCCNKKLLDRYVNIKEVCFFLNNLDSKSPIYIGRSHSMIIGLIFPIRRPTKDER